MESKITRAINGSVPGVPLKTPVQTDETGLPVERLNLSSTGSDPGDITAKMKTLDAMAKKHAQSHEQWKSDWEAGPFDGASFSACDISADNSILGSLYSNGSCTDIASLDGATGNVKWRMSLKPLLDELGELSGRPVRSLGGDEALLILKRKSDNNALIVAVDGKKGEKKWGIDFGDSPFAILDVKRGRTGDTVLLSGNHHIEIREAGSGQSICRTSRRKMLTGAVQRDNGDIYAGELLYEKGKMICFDPSSGKAKWETPLAGELHHPVIGPDGNLYCSSTIFKNHSKNHGCMYAINPDDGKVLWEHPVSQCLDSFSVSRSGTVYLMTHDSEIQALDSATGKEKWTKTPAGAGIDEYPLGMEVLEGERSYVSVKTPNFISICDEDLSSVKARIPIKPYSLDCLDPAAGKAVSITPEGRVAAHRMPLETGSDVDAGELSAEYRAQKEAMGDDLEEIRIDDTSVTIGGVRLEKRMGMVILGNLMKKE